MGLKFKYLLLLIIPQALIFSCKKDYSFERSTLSSGLSVFDFTGAPGLCTNAIIADSARGVIK